MGAIGPGITGWLWQFPPRNEKYNSFGRRRISIRILCWCLSFGPLPMPIVGSLSVVASCNAAITYWLGPINNSSDTSPWGGMNWSLRLKEGRLRQPAMVRSWKQRLKCRHPVPSDWKGIVDRSSIVDCELSAFDLSSCLRLSSRQSPCLQSW